MFMQFESCFVFVPPSTHTHTHTHTHSNFFFKEKKDTQLHTNIWRVMSGKNNQRNRAYSLCLCTMHACSVAQLCPTPQQKRFFFFLKSNSRDFSDGPLIKRLHLPMKGCRINPWSGNPTCLKAKNPTHKKKNSSPIREPRYEMIKPQNKMENYRAEETNGETKHH